MPHFEHFAKDQWNLLNGQLTGLFPSLVPPHPIRDHEKGAFGLPLLFILCQLDKHIVLIDSPTQANMGLMGFFEKGEVHFATIPFPDSQNPLGCCS